MKAFATIFVLVSMLSTQVHAAFLSEADKAMSCNLIVGEAKFSGEGNSVGIVNGVETPLKKSGSGKFLNFNVKTEDLYVDIFFDKELGMLVLQVKDTRVYKKQSPRINTRLNYAGDFLTQIYESTEAKNPKAIWVGCNGLN